MIKQIRFTNLNLAEYDVYCDMSSDIFLAVTKQEAQRINIIVAHERNQGVSKEDIDPTAVAEAWPLIHNPETNKHEIMDNNASGYYPIRNLEYHEVKTISIKE